VNVDINIELVKGCVNKRCPSYGKNCRPEIPSYMTEKVLYKILVEIAQNLDRPELYLYGRAEAVSHPRLEKMTEIVRGFFPKSRLCLSTDINMVNMVGPAPYSLFDKVTITYKEPSLMYCEFDFDFLSSVAEMGHMFITRKVDREFLTRLDNYLDDIPPDHRVVIAPLHDISFSCGDTETGRPGLELDEFARNLLGEEMEPSEGSGVRAFYDINGKLNTCLFNSSSFSTLKEHLAGQQLHPCKSCRMKTRILQVGR